MVVQLSLLHPNNALLRATLETKPTANNTKAEIQEYLDNQGIVYQTNMTKAQLLELV